MSKKLRLKCLKGTAALTVGNYYEGIKTTKWNYYDYPTRLDKIYRISKNDNGGISSVLLNKMQVS